MEIKLNFPDTITANALSKNSVHYSDRDEELGALSEGRLVVAYDNPKDNDDTPVKFYGFLNKIIYDSNGSVRYEVFCPNGGCTLTFDTALVVEELACPKIYYIDGELQGVGHLVGMLKPIRGENTDRHTGCRIRVAPWDEERYCTVTVDQITFVDNITVGIVKEADND